MRGPEPHIGEPTLTTSDECQYARTPNDPLCQRQATHHVIVEGVNLANEYGLMGLPTCTDHLGIARATAYVVGAHPHTPSCTHPDAIWEAQVDRCVVW